MILSIESSCDDSSIGITSIEDCELLWHKKISQESIHNLYGGVVPEIASRMHADNLPKLLKDALAAIPKESFKAIAITTEPGLSVTLIEGLMMAKVLSLELKIPLISINHLKGHIFSLFINQKSLIFPLSVLLVSGGHTQIIEARGMEEMEIIASTKDDSFGESFDKVAKMLGLSYPGGPIIQENAREYEGELYDFPIPLRNHPGIGFSFSGLKNATRLQIEKEAYPYSKNSIQKIAKSFQAAACKHLLQQLERYFKGSQIQDFAIVGGASANLFLRELVEKLCLKYQKTLHLVPLKFCSDNAAMIGRAAVEKFKRGQFASLAHLQCSPKSSADEFL
ncbi:tRNA (adenosine(37)-N6)-threonylcarbamoyltransferase complex transferase subunit TsaD [Helicobacter mustelae]|nr:tRNA (adenosine(37)-N6)-threonylcarbamoyltransferase complex transferase subunit TsaD [Helicobacter mustelae]SQH71537.1 glycoprotease [Helicobacter mustelae]STP12662.1 glycoprotease [Helicobacter mustelae]